LVFSEQLFLKIVKKVQIQRFVYVLDPVTSDDVISGQNQNIQLFVSRAALNLIFGMLSVQLKFNNNVERLN